MKKIIFQTATTRNRIKNKSYMSPYRSDYLRIYANLQSAHQKIVLSRSVDFLWDLMTTVEKKVLLRLVRAPATLRRQLDIIDAGENLPALIKDAADTEQGRQIIVAKQILRCMRAKTRGSLDWHANAFISRLALSLNLTSAECDLVYGLCLLESSPISASLAYLARSVAEFARFISTALSLKNCDILELCNPGGKLMSAGLLNQTTDAVCLGENILDGFRGDMTVEQYIFLKYRVDTGSVYDLESFDSPQDSLRVIDALLKSAKFCNILLYGKPGTGKTELARSLIRASGRKIVVVEPRECGRHENRLTRVQLATYFAHNTVLVVDESEDILNTESRDMDLANKNIPTKGLLNTFLDQSHGKIIWIVNDYGGIHESTMRRFHFKMRFDRLSFKQRTYALDLILHKHGEQELRDKPFIQKIAQDDFLTPGILDRVIESYSATKRLLPDLPAEKAIPILVASHSPQKRKPVSGVSNTEYYSRDILNVTGDLNGLFDAARKFSRADKMSDTGLNILIHGLPGTGKTEFVRHVARECGLDLILKRGSDLLSMFVGGTEENIAAAFRDAEKNRAILLVDEADTFFSARENAVRSWEISQTNEFLNQMENHKTMLFCCTNFLSQFDTAAMRRFHFKCEFKTMLPERRTIFFLEFFKTLLSERIPDNKLSIRLSELSKLTVGDFKAVKKRYSFKEPNSISWQELVKELEVECKYKQVSEKKILGF